MLFENQNRYKQCFVQENTLLFLPVLMVKSDYRRLNPINKGTHRKWQNQNFMGLHEF
jgi:hypothetical protein